MITTIIVTLDLLDETAPSNGAARGAAVDLCDEQRGAVAAELGRLAPLRNHLLGARLDCAARGAADRARECARARRERGGRREPDAVVALGGRGGGERRARERERVPNASAERERERVQGVRERGAIGSRAVRLGGETTRRARTTLRCPSSCARTACTSRSVMSSSNDECTTIAGARPVPIARVYAFGWGFWRT